MSKGGKGEQWGGRVQGQGDLEQEGKCESGKGEGTYNGE